MQIIILISQAFVLLFIVYSHIDTNKKVTEIHKAIKNGFIDDEKSNFLSD